MTWNNFAHLHGMRIWWTIPIGVYLHNYKNYEIILLSEEQAFSTLDITEDQDEVYESHN